jgi:hypothetical protein
VDDEADDPRPGSSAHSLDSPTGSTVEVSTIDRGLVDRQRQLSLLVVVVAAAVLAVVSVRPWVHTGGRRANRSASRHQASTTAANSASVTHFTTTTTPAWINGTPALQFSGISCANGFFTRAITQELEHHVGDPASCDLVGDTWIVSYLTPGQTNGVVAYLRCAPTDTTCHRSRALHDFAAFTAAYLGPVPDNGSYVQFAQGEYPPTPPSIKVYAFVPGSGNPYPPLPQWTMTASVSLTQNRIILGVACLKGRTNVGQVPYRDAFVLVPGTDRQLSLIPGAQVLSQPMPIEPVTTRPNCCPRRPSSRPPQCGRPNHRCRVSELASSERRLAARHVGADELAPARRNSEESLGSTS